VTKFNDLFDKAKKGKPDPGKLRRWGNRLVDLGEELGLGEEVNRFETTNVGCLRWNRVLVRALSVG